MKSNQCRTVENTVYYEKKKLVGQWDSLFLNVDIPPNEVPVLLFYGVFNPIHDNYSILLHSVVE